MRMTRRQFLHSTLAAGSGLALAQSPLAAIEPIRRQGPASLKLSLAAYSYRKYLTLNIKPKPPMTLFDFVDAAAQMKIDAIEPTAYYFAETTPDYLDSLKKRCAVKGLKISGTAVGNDFCVQDPAKLKDQIASVKKWCEHAARLEARTIRIFAGRVPKGEPEEKARARCIEAIQEACDHAGKLGVILALENHGGITATLDQMMALVKAVKHDSFGVNLDTGNFHTADPYADLEKLAPYAVTVQIKTEIQRAGQKKEEADLKRLIGMLRKVQYQGYVALEYEAEEDPKIAVPKHMETLKKLVG